VDRRFDEVDAKFVQSDNRFDEVLHTIAEVMQAIHEKFAESKREVNERFDKLEARVGRIEETMVTKTEFNRLEARVGRIEETMVIKTQFEVLVDVLRTNGVISHFEGRKVSKVQPAV
jgi:predicted nuclease with TOPRIM domain